VLKSAKFSEHSDSESDTVVTNARDFISQFRPNLPATETVHKSSSLGDLLAYSLADIYRTGLR